MSVVALLCLAPSLAAAQSITRSSPVGNNGVIRSTGMGYRRPAIGSSAPAQAAPQTLRGNLDGPVGDRVVTDGVTPSAARGDDRFADIDDVKLALFLTPAPLRYHMLEVWLPRIADVQRLDELMPLLADAGERRQTQALLDRWQ